MCITFWSLLSTSEYFSRMSKPNSFAASMALRNEMPLGKSNIKKYSKLWKYNQILTIHFERKIWIRYEFKILLKGCILQNWNNQ